MREVKLKELMTIEKRTHPGFTIVELLIVIVVIGLLAAISIVAYNGIQARARASAASSALSQAAKKIAVWQVDNPSVSPPNLAAAGVNNGNDVAFQYSQTSSGTSYCITATSGTVSYRITDTTKPTAGGCAGHGTGGQSAVTNLATNPSFETNTTTHNGARGVLTLDATKGASGLASGKYVADGTVGANYLVTTLSSVGGDITGQKVSASIKAQRDATVESLVLRIYFRDAANVILLSIDGSSVALNTSGWTEASVSGVAPSGTTNVVFYSLLTPNSMVAGTTVWFDAMMVRIGDPVSYYDGSSTNWVWNGTANASTSTGPSS